MKIIPPITVTDAMLVSINVAEGPAANYNAGTTYAAGPVVSGVTAASLKTQYASLQAGNTGHTPGVAGSEAWWRAIGWAANPYNAGTTYAAYDAVQIDTGGVHQLWWSVVDDNTGNDPAADAGDHWLLMSATNRWAMSDLKLGFGLGNTRVATRWGGLIDVTWAPNAPVDTVVAYVLQAQSVQVTVTDAGAVVIYDRTIVLTGDPAEEKWQLDGVPHMRPVAFEDVVFTAGSHVRMQIANPGGVAACAEVTLGKSIFAGNTQWGARVGIQDYSKIEPDDFGTFQVTKRPWHRRTSQEVWMDPADVDPCIDLLTQWRGSPMQFIGQPGYRSTIVFGLVRAFEHVLTFADLAVCSLDLESF